MSHGDHPRVRKSAPTKAPGAIIRGRVAARGLAPQLEADPCQYDFTTLDARVRDTLALDAASDDDDDFAFKGVIA